MFYSSFTLVILLGSCWSAATANSDDTHSYTDHRSISPESSHKVYSPEVVDTNEQNMKHVAMHQHADMDHDHVKHEEHEGHNHDHSNHAGHMDMDMDMPMPMNGSHGMPMFFHVGMTAVILFDGWRIHNIGGLIASMFGIVLMGILYEALKYFREYLFKQYISSMQFSTVAVTGESGRVTQVHKVEKHRMLSAAHTIQTVLHVTQIVLSYFLMLIFMTYNVWLCLSVVLGSGIGYFMFGWRKATVVDITEHCHN